MKDRVPTKPGRVKLTKADGSSEYVTMERADEPTQVGTPLNKGTLLSDATAAALGLAGDATVNDGLAKLALGPFKIGDTLSTLRTDLGNKWLLCNGAVVDATVYPSLYALLSAVISGAAVGGYGTPRDIASDGTTYVACGYDHTTSKAFIKYSTDPAGSSVWTSVNIVGSYGWRPTKVAVHDGMWVAIGHSTDTHVPFIATATDPTGDWTVQNISEYECYLTGLAFAFGQWIAVGSDGTGANTRAFTTANPLSSWAVTTINTADSFMLEDLEFNGTVLCAVGYGKYNNYPYALVKEGASGSWVLKKLSSTLYFHLNSIAYASGMWVAAGQYTSTLLAAVYASADLITWTFKQIVNSPVAYNGAFVGYWNESWHVGFSGNGYYPAVATAADPLLEWGVTKLSDSDYDIYGLASTQQYLFILGMDHSSSNTVASMLLKRLPQISINGVYTYIKALEG
ncbi:MAG: phage tail protein [Lachnospirales bacterium]